MGYRDGAKFEERFREYWASLEMGEFQEASEEHRKLKESARRFYFQAYDQGWESSRDYDPKWDAD